ncbi:MAG TPA: NAD(P)/FAD-dependent oxidoreductase [Vicinamibacteria bacterium]|jgi:geranylgeranyl reductase family protein
MRDVIVAGGGPAGAAVALFLRQRGHDVLLLEAARFPRDKVCGESVSPEAWALLEEAGVAAGVRGLRPHPVRGMRLVSPAGIAFRGRYREGRTGFAARRRDLDAVLLGSLRRSGVEVAEGTRVTGVVRAGGAVSGVEAVNGGGPQRLEARLVVAAEGRRSVIARRLGLLREHATWRKFAVRGYWEGMQGLAEEGEMHVGGGGYCGVAPLSPTRANVAFVLDRRSMAAAGGDLQAFYCEALRTRWPRLSERLQGATLEEPPRAVGPLALSARRLSAPGALLVGDAAGFYDPFTGEGVTLALRSARLAAEAADAHLRHGTDLRAYDRARLAATRDKFRFNRLLQRIVAWPALADHVARRLRDRPALADRLVGVAGDFVPAREALSLRLLGDLLL